MQSNAKMPSIIDERGREWIEVASRDDHVRPASMHRVFQQPLHFRFRGTQSGCGVMGTPPTAILGERSQGAIA